MQSKKRRTNITFWGTFIEMLKEGWQLVAKLSPSPYWRARFFEYGRLMRIERPIGTLLLLWPTLWALWLANDAFPPVHLIVVFTLGVFLTRSAGCVINDFADRHLDGKVERTKERPFAHNAVSEKEAIFLFIGLSLVAFMLVLTLNLYSIILSFIAIVIATIYPFMKRITYFPQVVLGAAFSMSIPMAFAASQNEVPTQAWLLYIANLLWVLAYDTLYGMVDKKDDIKAGIKSTAILFGEADLQIIGMIQGFFIFGMLMVGIRFELNFWYYLSLLGAIGFIAWQLYHCQTRRPENCFNAFLNNNWVGASLFCGILISKSF